MDAKLESYVRAGEGMNLEFKRCGGKVERDVYETICSFANRQGGPYCWVCSMTALFRV